jgi:hypothetical protein
VTFKWVRLPGAKFQVAAPHVLLLGSADTRPLRLEIWRKSDTGLSRSKFYTLALREPVSGQQVKAWGEVRTATAAQELAETLLGTELAPVDASGQPL